MVIVLGMVESKTEKVPCHKVYVEIQDSASNYFITNQEIYTMIISRDKKLMGKSLKEVRTDEVEAYLEKVPFVKKAEAFKTSNGVLNIRINQREPLARILTYKGSGYYIDRERYIMPVSPYYTARVLIVNGWNLSGIKAGKKFSETSDSKVKSNLENVYQLAMFINDDPFWQAQIEQVYVNKNGEFTFIPRVGSHTIIFGGIDRYERKFKKLYTLYEQGLKNEGWNTYSKINLKYKNQVVCTKRNRH